MKNLDKTSIWSIWN